MRPNSARCVDIAKQNPSPTPLLSTGRGTKYVPYQRQTAAVDVDPTSLSKADSPDDLCGACVFASTTSYWIASSELSNEIQTVNSF